MDGDTVIVRYGDGVTFENELAIEQGPFAGLHTEPTGDTIAYSGIYISRFEDWEVIEWENHPDRLSAFEKLGLLDQPE